MTELIREYKGDAECLSPHHPDKPGAKDDSCDCTALILLAASGGDIGDIVVALWRINMSSDLRKIIVDSINSGAMLPFRFVFRNKTTLTGIIIGLNFSDEGDSVTIVDTASDREVKVPLEDITEMGQLRSQQS
ncbi:MAG: hypothetical protein R3C11_29560 [Planctomycetaceae bacterium]